MSRGVIPAKAGIQQKLIKSGFPIKLGMTLGDFWNDKNSN